ncbi:MAG: hypothetical protein ACFB5Z_20045 [Elainellaceae cyanobacterium]
MTGKISIRQLSLLGLWTAIAVGLRLQQLNAKPLWADEISTLAFSLGHGFGGVPLGQLIMADKLLQPLQVDGATTATDAAQSLLAESNHPPLFFMLMHTWLQLTHADGSTVGLAAARSLSALIGGLLTPLAYGLALLALRSPVAAQMAAALMALSPFGLYLSQEARHYTLALLWIAASLCCLADGLRRMARGKPLPYGLVLLWTAVNGFGLATHYFVAIALLSEVLVLAGFMVYWRGTLKNTVRGAAGRIGLVAVGTAASGLVWIWVLVAAPNQGQLTRWIQSSWGLGDWVNPVTHTAASAITMAYLLPIQGVPAAAAAVSTLLLLAIALWSLWGVPWRDYPPQAAALWGTCAAAVAILWAITYSQQIGLAQVLRYHFVYFPAFVVAVAAGLAHRWRSGRRTSRLLVAIALLVSLAGSLSVAYNLAYQKVHRPDLVATDIAKDSAQGDIIIAASHQSHGQTGRLMAIAWALKRYPAQWPQVRFFLDPQPCAEAGEQNCGTPSTKLLEALPQGEADLWLINYVGQPNLRPYGCRYQDTDRVDGYKYQHYAC